MSKAKAKSPPHKTPSRKAEKPTPAKAQPPLAKAPAKPSARSGKGGAAGKPSGNGHATAPALSPEAHLAQVQQALGSFKSSSGSILQAASAEFFVATGPVSVVFGSPRESRDL